LTTGAGKGNNANAGAPAGTGNKWDEGIATPFHEMGVAYSFGTSFYEQNNVRAHSNAPSRSESRTTLAEKCQKGIKKGLRCGAIFSLCFKKWFYLKHINLVARGGIEPPTQGFSILCSTD
jgi:hypothetical protein